MNRILLVHLFLVTLLLTACGQYGDLYHPPQESEQKQADEDNNK